MPIEPLEPLKPSNKLFIKLGELATKIKSPTQLAAFRAVLIVLLVAILGFLSMHPISEYFRQHDIYQVRITVLKPDGTPSNASQVTSTLGGEPFKVTGGWQINVPPHNVSPDRILTVKAVEPDSFESGECEVKLDRDYSLQAIIHLSKRQDAYVSGLVEDSVGHSVGDARVFVVGWESEGITTKTDGGFRLGTHAAEGQMVLLHIEAAHYKPYDVNEIGGATGIQITLSPEVSKGKHGARVQ